MQYTCVLFGDYFVCSVIVIFKMDGYYVKTRKYWLNNYPRHFFIEIRLCKIPDILLMYKWHAFNKR